eukprot:2283575-Amphidinium_carterae.2
MVAKVVSVKGLSRAQINAVRFNVEDFLLRSSEETVVSSSPGQMKSCCSCQLRNHDSLTYSGACRPRQRITDADVIGGYTLEADSERSPLSAKSSVVNDKRFSSKAIRQPQIHLVADLGQSQQCRRDTTRTGCKPFRSMRQLITRGAMMTSRLHQPLSVNVCHPADPQWRPWTSRTSACGDRSSQRIQRQEKAKAMASQRALQPKARQRKDKGKKKESNIRSSSGVRVRINRKAISQVSITLSISNLQEKAKDPVHNAKAKASHQAPAGPLADQVTHQISAGGRVQYIR